MKLVSFSAGGDPTFAYVSHEGCCRLPEDRVTVAILIDEIRLNAIWRTDVDTINQDPCDQCDSVPHQTPTPPQGAPPSRAPPRPDRTPDPLPAQARIPAPVGPLPQTFSGPTVDPHLDLEVTNPTLACCQFSASAREWPSREPKIAPRMAPPRVDRPRTDTQIGRHLRDTAAALDQLDGPLPELRRVARPSRAVLIRTAPEPNRPHPPDPGQTTHIHEPTELSRYGIHSVVGAALAENSLGERRPGSCGRTGGRAWHRSGR